MEISIQITSMGGTMGVPVTILKRTLEDLGFEVSLSDNYGANYEWSDEEVQMVRERVPFSKGAKIGVATINTTSIPWGG